MSTTTSTTVSPFQQQLQDKRRRYELSRASKTKHVFGYELRERQTDLYDDVAKLLEEGYIDQGQADKIDFAIKSSRNTSELETIDANLDGKNAIEIAKFVDTLPIPPGYTDPVKPKSYKDDEDMTDNIAEENDPTKMGDVFGSNDSNVNKTPKSMEYRDPVDAQNEAARKSLGGQGVKKKETRRKLFPESHDKPKKGPFKRQTYEPIVVDDDEPVDLTLLTAEEIRILNESKALQEARPEYKAEVGNLCDKCHYRKFKLVNKTKEKGSRLCSVCERSANEKAMRRQMAALREEEKAREQRELQTIKQAEMIKARCKIAKKTAKLRKLNEDAA